jgi:hypothetical protein
VLGACGGGVITPELQREVVLQEGALLAASLLEGAQRLGLEDEQVLVQGDTGDTWGTNARRSAGRRRTEGSRSPPTRQAEGAWGDGA